MHICQFSPRFKSGLYSISLWLAVVIFDQYQYLGNCPSTPPLTQQQSIDNNLGLKS